MKCVNEWRGTAGLKASNPYKTSQSIPLAPQRRVKAAGATHNASASERRETDVRQYFRSSARGKHKLLLFPSCLRTRRECPAVQVMTQASPLHFQSNHPAPGRQNAQQPKSKPEEPASSTHACSLAPSSVSRIVSRLHSINGLRQLCLRHYYSFLITSLSQVARRISDRG
jgi:hypothetical protein